MLALIGAIFGGLWKAIRALPWWAWLVVGVLVAAYFYGEARYEAGSSEVQGRWDAATTQAEEAKRQFEGVTSSISVGVQTKVVERIKVVREKGDVIIQKVPVYIPAGTPDLPAGFRILHDAAVNQTAPPDSTAAADGSPVPVATAATTIFGNYATCHAEYVKLEGWQEWWKKIEAACKANSSCELLP